MRIFKKIFIDSYKGKIFNCHHSILPAFRGYYDARDKITQFHARDLFGRAVAYGSKIIGNTIHLIEDEYVDAGAPVIVSHLGVDPKIDPLQLRHQLFIQECQCFMQLITWLRNGRIKVSDSGVRVLDGNYQLSNFYPNLDEEFILKFTL
jgi:phosphoribosylglycinamide formyltransferase-1